MIDCSQEKYLHSIPDLLGVAGALVSNEKDLVFTSNRGEKTVGIFPHDREKRLEKVKVGGFPNGLAFDPLRDNLLAANVSRPDDLAPVSVSIVDVRKKILISDIEVPGRTRWAVFDNKTDLFYVNISKPSQIIAISSEDPDGIASTYEIPATGPHGLDIDLDGRRLFCACDKGGLYTVDLSSSKVSLASDLTGTPDVIFYNHALDHLYVTIGDPGVIEVFDTRAMKRIQTVKTDLGTHTIGINLETHILYAFMPESHRASIFEDK